MPVTGVHPPTYVLKILRTLEAGDHAAWVVGGALRNSLLGREPSDWDIATSATPEEVKALFPRHIPVGEKYGTIAVLMDGEMVEVTTFRGESEYLDGRRPQQVFYGVNLEDDLARRDFTFNAMAWHPERGLVDPFGGQEDLEHRIIRAVGDPVIRFREDALRMMRAVRFAAQLDFRLDKATGKAIRKNCRLLQHVSWERIRDEFSLILMSRHPERGLRLLRVTGLLQVILPECLEGYGMMQNAFHTYSVYSHCLFATAHTPPDLALRWAALLHDTGKARTKTVDKRGYVHFYSHEHCSAKIAEKVLTRFRCPGHLKKKVVLLIEQHMFRYAPDTTDAALRRIIVKVGPENIMDLVALRRADVSAMVPPSAWPAKAGGIETLEVRFKRLLEQDVLPSLRTLAVKGEDLMERFSLPPGPVIGELLHHLLEAVLNNPTVNKKEPLLALAGEWLRNNPPHQPGSEPGA